MQPACNQLDLVALNHDQMVYFNCLEVLVCLAIAQADTDKFKRDNNCL